jgi:AraC family transcriptional regulator
MKLAPGRFFGQTLHQCRHAGLTLNLSRYPPGRDQPLHVHTHPTLFIPLRGNHCEQTRARVHEQQELSAVFHPTRELHASIVGRELLGLNLELEPQWLQQQELTEGDLGGYRLLEPSVWSRLATLRLACLAFRPPPEGWGELHTQALELLEPLVRPMGEPVAPGRPRWLRRAEEFLHERFRSSISLRDVAREARVHPVYCARVFRSFHGCPVSAYLRALRVAEAGRLVLQHGQSLAQAALEAGFADQAHLSRCFRRQVGFSPRAVSLVLACLVRSGARLATARDSPPTRHCGPSGDQADEILSGARVRTGMGRGGVGRGSAPESRECGL